MLYNNHCKEVPTSNDQPYKKGEIHNVYQFPFGVADTSVILNPGDKLSCYYETEL
jgi:hypothetical protein